MGSGWGWWDVPDALGRRDDGVKGVVEGKIYGLFSCGL